MTKTKIALGVAGIALALTWVAWGSQLQLKQPSGTLTNRGNFRLTIGPQGVKCFKSSKPGASDHKEECEVKAPTGTVVNATSIVILETTNTCWIVHNNIPYEIPCL
jgi:hypothetical protein